MGRDLHTGVVPLWSQTTNLFQLVLHALASPPGLLRVVVCSVQVTRRSDCRTKLLTN